MDLLTPVTLKGSHAILEPLAQDHHDGLVEAARDGELWDLFYTSVPRPNEMQTNIEFRLGWQRQGGMLPFVVRRTADGRVVGATTYCNIELEHKRLEIGYTWYAKSAQRTAINTECKLLLLTHAFQTLGCVAVEFRTSWLNHPSRAAIERLAARLRAAPSAALHMSVGVNMGGFGTLAYVLLQALAWATGNYDRRGGLLVGSLARPVDRFYRWSGLHNEHESRIGGFPSLLGTLPGGVLADEILEPGRERIRALLVLAGDPLRSIPGAGRMEQALRSLELLACVDVFESATGRHAHALLPATTWLERWDVALASVPFLQGALLPVSGPVMSPIGEARSDAQIVGDLAVAMGLRGLRWRLARMPLDRWLPRPRFGLPVPRVRPGQWLRRNRLRLWDARVAEELRRLRAEPRPNGEPEGFTLVGRRRRLGHNSWLHGAQRSGEPEAVAWLSPQDLAALGVAEGRAIEIHSEIGMLRISTRAVEGLAPRTVVVPHGLPELNVNALIPGGPERIERVSGQLTMTGIPARIVPAPA